MSVVGLVSVVSVVSLVGVVSTKAKKSTEQYLLYGCDRTDAVMRTKTKKVPSKEFAMGY